MGSVVSVVAVVGAISGIGVAADSVSPGATATGVVTSVAIDCHYLSADERVSSVQRNRVVRHNTGLLDSVTLSGKARMGRFGNGNLVEPRNQSIISVAGGPAD